MLIIKHIFPHLSRYIDKNFGMLIQVASSDSPPSKVDSWKERYCLAASEWSNVRDHDIRVPCSSRVRLISKRTITRASVSTCLPVRVIHTICYRTALISDETAALVSLVVVSPCVRLTTLYRRQRSIINRGAIKPRLRRNFLFRWVNEVKQAATWLYIFTRIQIYVVVKEIYSSSFRRLQWCLEIYFAFTATI